MAKQTYAYTYFPGNFVIDRRESVGPDAQAAASTISYINPIGAVRYVIDQAVTNGPLVFAPAHAGEGGHAKDTASEAPRHASRTMASHLASPLMAPTGRRRSDVGARTNPSGRSLRIHRRRQLVPDLDLIAVRVQEEHVGLPGYELAS